MSDSIKGVYHSKTSLAFSFLGRVTNHVYWCIIYNNVKSANIEIRVLKACGDVETDRNRIFLLFDSMFAHRYTESISFQKLSKLSLEELRVFFWGKINPLFDNEQKFLNNNDFNIIFTKNGTSEEFLHLSRAVLYSFVSKRDTNIFTIDISIPKQQNRRAFTILPDVKNINHHCKKRKERFMTDMQNVYNLFQPYGYFLKEYKNRRTQDQYNGYIQIYCDIILKSDDILNLPAREHLVLKRDYLQFKKYVKRQIVPPFTQISSEHTFNFTTN